MSHEGKRPRRDIYAVLLQPTTLIRAMEFRRVGVREFAAQIEISNQVLALMRTGRVTRCSPEMARKIEEGLKLAPGSLFTLHVRYASERAQRNELVTQEGDVA